jgi:hypothetical protein
MISLAHDCMLFELSSGEAIPFSAEMISVELMGDAVSELDPEIIRNAAAAVFHYFRHELERDSVTVGEFALMLEKVLRGLGLNVRPAETTAPDATPVADLVVLARESGAARELVFFPRLRNELRVQLQGSPRVVRFRGLRRCVKHLAGARRWCPRCENLRDQIVAYLRGCLTNDSHELECRLVVE